MDAEAGVGVLELLVAIFVAAMIVVFVMPSLENYQKLRDLRQASRQLASDLRLTQQYAGTLDEPVRLTYTASPAPGYTIAKSAGGQLKSAALPVTISVSGSYASGPAEFIASGAPTAAGEFCLTEGTQIMRVDVTAGTGRVQVTEVATCP